MSDLGFTATATGFTVDVDIFQAFATFLATIGRPVFVGEAHFEPELPYAVVNADWEPQPDVGGGITAMPTAHKASFQVNSYGRANQDAIWLDSRITTALFVGEPDISPFRLLWKDADLTPVVTRTKSGLILAKHWYRIVYTRGGTS